MTSVENWGSQQKIENKYFPTDQYDLIPFDYKC